MSCELHLDFGRKIRYNNYVVYKIEYAGVSEWHDEGDSKSLASFREAILKS